MKNMKVSMKLIVSFLVVIVLAVLVGAVGIIGMSSINNADKDLYDSNLLAISYVGKIRTEYNIQRAAIRDLALYSYEDSAFQTALDTITDSETSMTELIELYQGTIEDKEDQDLFDTFTKAYTADFADVKKELKEHGSKNETSEAIEILKTRGAATQAIIGPALGSCMDLNEQKGKEAVAGNGTLFTSMTIIEVVMLLVAIVVSMFFAVYISSLISKPVTFMKNVLMKIGTKGDLHFTDAEYRTTEEYAKVKDEVGESVGMLLTTVRRLVKVGDALETVAEGDLTAELALLSSDDTMGNSLQTMIDNLNNMFSEINQSTAQVSTGSKQIADGAQALAQGSTQQAAAVEQLSSSISEIANKTKENAGMADKAATLAETIKHNAEKGSQQMDQMMDAVKEINQASQSINKVIKVIDDIAFQTNILALNAAVEAARAGQHGKGFAVVAEEVRNLAAKSAEAAKDTGGLIANSMEKAELGAKIADETAASLVEIVAGINESSQIVGEIARSSEEQSEGIMQINKGIDQVAQVVQQNSATAEESAAASEEMSGQSNMLEELISQFKLKNGNSSGRKSLSAPKSSGKRLEMPEKSTYYSEDDFGKY